MICPARAGRALLAWAAATLVAPLPGVSAEGLGHSVEDVVDGVILFRPAERGVGNIVAVIGETGVLVVDSGITPSGADAVIAEIRSRTDLPVQYLVNTHWHDDHIWGNQSFTDAYPEITVIAHETTRTDILERAVPALSGQIARIDARLARNDSLLAADTDAEGNPLSDDVRAKMVARQKVFREFNDQAHSIRPTPPTRTFSDRLVLYPDKDEIHLLSLGSGHTRGDVVVYVPARGVAITGDLVTHPVPAAAEAFPVAWIETLEALLALDFEVAVPGHGPPLYDRGYIELMAATLKSIVSQVRTARNQGLDLAAAAAAVQVEGLREQYADPGTTEDKAFARFFLQPAIESVYRELDQWEARGNTERR